MVSALILKSDGTNCDYETAFAFRAAGAQTDILHLNQLISTPTLIHNYQIICFPGGFTYGDEIGSGKILAVFLLKYLKSDLQRFVSEGKLLIGICNGFQTLVKAGFLPFNTPGTPQATLINNHSGKFECRPVRLLIDSELSPLTRGLQGSIVGYQSAHGEGRFYASKNTIDRIEKEHLILWRYANTHGKPTQSYPDNPNGSPRAIAGICDPSGQIIGLMPHPERAFFQDGSAFFKKAVLYSNGILQTFLTLPLRQEIKQKGER